MTHPLSILVGGNPEGRYPIQGSKPLPPPPPGAHTKETLLVAPAAEALLGSMGFETVVVPAAESYAANVIAANGAVLVAAEAVETAGGTLSGGLGAESAEDLEAAHAAAAALTAAGVDTYHLSTWSSSDFYGETTEQVLLVKIQQHGGGPESPVILAAVKQSGDPRVPGAKPP